MEPLMSDTLSKTYEKMQRQSFRTAVNRIWTLVKDDKFSDLNPQEQKLAAIIMEHLEYREHFENEDILDGCEYDSGDGFNPFLHISLHNMAEDQLASEMPVEAALLCESLETAGYKRHEAIHAIIMILIHLIYDAYVNRKPFDKERYRRLLLKCKNVKPSQMQDVVEREFKSH
jgi:hypothetical protein